MVSTTGARHRGVVAALGACCLTVVAGCSGGGVLAMTSSATAVVSVRDADDEVTKVQPSGGVATHTDRCAPAPLVITYADGQQVTVDASLCPGQQLRIQDGSARVVELPDG